MSKKSSLSFSIKKSLLVGTISAATLASGAGCTVNPVPETQQDAGDEDTSDAGDTDTDGEDDAMIVNPVPQSDAGDEDTSDDDGTEDEDDGNDDDDQ